MKIFGRIVVEILLVGNWGEMFGVKFGKTIFGGNFDIIEPPVFQKYSIHWVLEALCICLCLCLGVFIFVFVFL